MIIQSTKVYFEERLQPLQLIIEDGKIQNIVPYGLFKDALDFQDAIILPGLVDVHNHGYFHGECNNASTEWLENWTSYLPSEGVTSTLFSFSCGDHKKISASLKVYKEYVASNPSGTQLIGVYSEGPFIGQRPGAQDPEYKLIPTKEIIDQYIKESGNHFIYAMVAPEELNDNYDVISYCRKKGIKVAIGHSAAPFEVCQKAIAAGVSSFTHTYNGMTGLHHREPGVVGAAMYHDNCYCEMICDGIHVNKYSANILARIKGKDRLMLITDSVSLKGYKPGQYPSNNHTLIVGEDGSIKDTNGTISGSANRLNKVLKYAIEEAKIDPVTAFNAATKNPCDFLGFTNKGQIKVGFDADIVILDKDFEPELTLINGNIAYKK